MSDLQNFVEMLKRSGQKFEVLAILHALVVAIEPEPESGPPIWATFDPTGTFVEIGGNCSEHDAKWPRFHGCRVCGAPCPKVRTSESKEKAQNDPH